MAAYKETHTLIHLGNKSKNSHKENNMLKATITYHAAKIN